MAGKKNQSLSAGLIGPILFFSIGCGVSEPPSESAREKPKQVAPQVAAQPTAPQLPTQPTLRDEKGEVICPVTGKRIPDVSRAAGWADYKGLRYYFCSPACPEKFARAPDKYAVKR